MSGAWLRAPKPQYVVANKQLRLMCCSTPSDVPRMTAVAKHIAGTRPEATAVKMNPNK